MPVKCYLKEIHIAPTFDCNSGCAHCWNHKRKKEPTLQLSDLQFFIDNYIYAPNIETIVLTGGQVDLYTGLFELCRLLARYFPRATIVLTTNYLNPERTVKNILKIRNELSPSNLLYISMPLEGPPGLHRIIRGNSSYLDEVMERLQIIKLHNTILGTSFTITPLNYHALYWAYSYSSSQNLDFWASPFSRSYFYNNLKLNWSFLPLDKMKLSTQIDCVLSDLSKKQDPEIITKHNYFLGLKAFMCNPASFYMPTCRAGSEYVVIDSQGKLKPCVLIDKEIGTLRKGLNACTPNEIRRQFACSCWTVCHAYGMAKKG